jgi:hypothetical protein
LRSVFCATPNISAASAVFTYSVSLVIGWLLSPQGTSNPPVYQTLHSRDMWGKINDRPELNRTETAGAEREDSDAAQASPTREAHWDQCGSRMGLRGVAVKREPSTSDPGRVTFKRSRRQHALHRSPTKTMRCAHRKYRFGVDRYQPAPGGSSPPTAFFWLIVGALQAAIPFYYLRWWIPLFLCGAVCAVVPFTLLTAWIDCRGIARSPQRGDDARNVAI